MGWSIGWDENWKRDIGYSIPAYCDHPKCNKDINRGIAYVCGGEPYGGDVGCGLYFCSEHLSFSRSKEAPQLCPRCNAYKPPYKKIKPEHPDWIKFKMTDPSWAEWRKLKTPNPS